MPDAPLDPGRLFRELGAMEGSIRRGDMVLAAAQARRLLDFLERETAPDSTAAVADDDASPPDVPALQREWRRIADQFAADPARRAQAQRDLIRWRAHTVLAESSGTLDHYYEAALACPDSSRSRAALGCALARAGRFREAANHLRRAVSADPADAAAARALTDVLARLQVRASVSLCMIVKNEEDNLPRCLGSVAGLVDEIVLVDTGSTDRTREIAAGFGARVVEFPWVDDFAAARNESLAHATGVWIFWMDADDCLDEPNREKLRALFAGLENDRAAYVMKCLCLPDGPDGASSVVDHVRLFRNDPKVRWKYRVHEQILPAVRRAKDEVRWTDVVIHHTGYQDPALRGRKLQRDLRLLHMDLAERSEDPFTLFNLGSVLQELGQPGQALPHLRRSLELSAPRDSIVRKLYALIVQCHRQLGETLPALAACQAGRRHYPEDAELLFLEGLAYRDQGDLAGAETAWKRLLVSEDKPHFASVDADLRGPKVRRNLAILHEEQGRWQDAESQWRSLSELHDDCLAGWLGLADLLLAQKRLEELDPVERRLEATPAWSTQAKVLRARRHLARKEFAEAKQVLETAIAESPTALRPRVILSHVLLQENRDEPAAEEVLRSILRLEPNHPEAQRNLAVLLARGTTVPEMSPHPDW